MYVFWLEHEIWFGQQETDNTNQIQVNNMSQDLGGLLCSRLSGRFCVKPKGSTKVCAEENIKKKKKKKTHTDSDTVRESARETKEY